MRAIAVGMGLVVAVAAPLSAQPHAYVPAPSDGFVVVALEHGGLVSIGVSLSRVDPVTMEIQETLPFGSPRKSLFKSKPPSPTYKVAALTAGRYVLRDTWVQPNATTIISVHCAGTAWFDIRPGQIAYLGTLAANSMSAAQLKRSGLAEAEAHVRSYPQLTGPVSLAALSPGHFIDPKARGQLKACRQPPVAYDPMAMPHDRGLEKLLSRIEKGADTRLLKPHEPFYAADPKP